MFLKKIDELLKNKKISRNKLLSDLNLGKNSFVNWEKRGNIPNGNTLQRIADYFDVSVDYLLSKEKAPETSSANKGIRIPVYGKIAAGIPLNAIEDIEDWEEIPEDMAVNGEYMALKIKGDSMEPKIENGDTVIIRCQPDAETGDIVAVIINGDEATCKKLKKTERGIMLVPLNSTYEPMFFTNHEVTELPVRILGKIVEIRRKL